MVELYKIVNFLDKNLRIADFPEDKSQNGLQVSPENPAKNIKKIAVSVDATQEVFEKSKNHDLLIVHHGLLWSSNPTITGIFRNRLKTLLENDLPLYACHLPLDAHETYGNNAELIRLIGASIKYKFDVGYVAEFPEPVETNKIVSILNEKLKTKCKLHGVSKDKIKKILVCSGRGVYFLNLLRKYQVDAFLVGEITHPYNKDAEELEIQLIIPGHYATETLGVQAIGRKLKKLYPELQIDFIDCPTGL